MSKLLAKWKQSSAFMRAFVILALVFFLLGMGTLGDVRSAGRGFELKEGATVVFRLEAAEGQKTLKGIYVNVGTVYKSIGNTTSLRIRRSQNGSSWFQSGFGEFTVANVYTGDEDAITGASFNWISPFDLSEKESNLSTYPYFELTARDGTVLVNEVVFVADDGTLIKATVDKSLSGNINTDAAAALLDSQYVPSMGQSSFFRFGDEEAYTLMTIAEMYRGGAYTSGNVYHADGVYNAFGIDLLALSTLIFGMSPFGLRLLPFLACFGVLLLGASLARRLFRSDKAGLAFGLLYVLAGGFLSLGHLGTPLMLGVFFWMLSFYLGYLFYANGMKQARVRSAMPVLFSGLSAAASVCVSGAFLLPAAGTVALFVAGMVRQQRAKKYQIEKAAEEDKPQVRAEFRYKNRVAPVLFATALLLGTFLLLILSVIPVYLTYVKVFDDPLEPALTLFALIGKGFAGAFSGYNLTSYDQTGWDYLYRTFAGSGDPYAVTLVCFNFVAIFCAAAGFVYAVVRVALSFVGRRRVNAAAASTEEEKQALLEAESREKRARRALLRSFILPAAAAVLCLIATSYTVSSLMMLALVYVFAFLIAAGAVSLLPQKGFRIVFPVAIVFLSACFVVLIPFLFSIPLPASWMSVLFA